MIQTCSLVKSTPSAAIFKTGGELLRIEAISETILRVSFTGREEFLLQDNGMIEPLEPAALNICLLYTSCSFHYSRFVSRAQPLQGGIWTLSNDPPFTVLLFCSLYALSQGQGPRRLQRA